MERDLARYWHSMSYTIDTVNGYFEEKDKSDYIEGRKAWASLNQEHWV